MAHLYDNFDDAFAAFTADWQVNQDLHIDGRGDADTAYNANNNPVELFEFQSLCLAVISMSNLIWNLIDIRESAPDRSAFCESIYWANKDVPAVAEYELTLVKMIEAYINADDDHRSAHRLLLDAYQASMYDKPFDKEYHALWVQRFRSWA